MKGLYICLLVVVAATAVRSQGPPTQTRKGTRPARRNDNPDVGLPSGADVPDGRRLVPADVPPRGAAAARPAPARAGPPPAAAPVRAGPPPPARTTLRAGPPPPRRAGPPPATRPAVPVAPAARPAPVRAGPPPPAAKPAFRPNVLTRTRAGPPPPRRNDNPDFGLPSGRDFPDAGLAPPAAPAVPAVPAPAPYVPPVVPGAPPVYDCDFFCKFEPFKPVCTIFGNEYDNDCYRRCRNEPRECENVCPCNAPPATPPATPPPMYGNPWDKCSHCLAEGNDPVCVDDETNYQNECFALCEGKTITCSSSCPC